jgi:hypothetical protein
VEDLAEVVTIGKVMLLDQERLVKVLMEEVT